MKNIKIHGFYVQSFLLFHFLFFHTKIIFCIQFGFFPKTVYFFTFSFIFSFPSFADLVSYYIEFFFNKSKSPKTFIFKKVLFRRCIFFFFSHNIALSKKQSKLAKNSCFKIYRFNLLFLNDLRSSMTSFISFPTSTRTILISSRCITLNVFFRNRDGCGFYVSVKLRIT